MFDTPQRNDFATCCFSIMKVKKLKSMTYLNILKSMTYLHVAIFGMWHGLCMAILTVTQLLFKLFSFLQFVIVVIDSTDRGRLPMIREELYKMLANEELSKAGVLVYANKQDVKGSMSASEISKELDLTSIKKQQWHIQSCCALTGEG